MAEALRDIFFEECEELLDQLISNLEQVGADNSDGETINAIFRAVHSIKGSAGAFGFADLVDFAHQYETVLDAVRSGRLLLEGELLQTVIRSSDVLAELVECARDDTSPPAATEGLKQDLGKLVDVEPLGTEADFSFEPTASEPAPFDPAPLDPGVFDPSPVDFVPEGLEIAPTTDFEIQFKPHAALYMSGLDPRHFIIALKRLGSVSVYCDSDAVPALAAFDFDQGYLCWRIDISDVVDENALWSVFEFAEGLCELKIEAREREPDNPGDGEGVGNPVSELAVAPDPVAGADSVLTPVEARADGAPPKPVKTTLRVDPDRVDRLINSVGELIINHAVLDRSFQENGLTTSTETAAALDDYGNLAREIQEAVMAIRAQPVKTLFQRMGRVVREAADATGKKVAYATDGEATEIDKTMLERLADPLTHMLRNAVDHGIENPDDRAAAGKPSQGVVQLSAFHRSGHVIIEISDDGAGLHRDRILAKAMEKNIIGGDAVLSDTEVFNLLFAPGFSTAQTVSNLSGRGVGMDVVKTAITGLGGKVTISSEAGQGSVFSIALPLTLAVLDGMIIRIGCETMVLPLSNIVETIRPDEQTVQSVGPTERVLAIRDTYVPIVNLPALLGFSDSALDGDELTYVLIDNDTTPFAIAVDAITDQRQVVIKSLKTNYGQIEGISAATILGDGNVALIVDTDCLPDLAARRRDRVKLNELEGQF